MKYAHDYAQYLIDKFNGDTKHAFICVEEIIRQNERWAAAYGQKFGGQFWTEVNQFIYDYNQRATGR